MASDLTVPPQSSLLQVESALETITSCATASVEVSVVIPCLNEAETLGTCIEKAIRSMREQVIRGEIIVADNGSSDASRTIARDLGAVVVDVKNKGYGSALMGGIAVAAGRFVIIGDADDSYNFAGDSKVCRETSPRL